MSGENLAKSMKQEKPKSKSKSKTKKGFLVVAVMDYSLDLGRCHRPGPPAASLYPSDLRTQEGQAIHVSETGCAADTL